MIPQIVRTALILVGGALVAFSQVEVSLQLPFAQQMPPQIAEWRENEALIRVLVQNTGRERYSGLVFSAELQRDGRRIATTRNGHPAQPRFDLGPGEVRSLSWREVIAEAAIEYDRSITEQVLTTGELPAGNYQLCMQVLDARLRPIGRPGCGILTITSADPPVLLSPIHGAQASVMPLLQWSPSSPSTPGLQYRVTLKVRYRGQTPAQAMASNPIRLQVDVPTSSYQVPVTEQLGPDAADPNYAGHVWQVQALVNGRPYGRNRGMSQIEWFTVPPLAVDPVKPSSHGWAHAVAHITLDEPNVPDTIRYVCDLPPGTPPDTVLVELEVEYPSSLSVSGGPISLQDRTGAILFGQLRPDSILIPVPVLAARGTSFYYAPDPKAGQQLRRVYNGYYLYGMHPGDTLGLEGVYPGGYYLFGMQPGDTLGLGRTRYTGGFFLYGMHPWDTLGLSYYAGGFYLYGMHPGDTMGTGGVRLSDEPRKVCCLTRRAIGRIFEMVCHDCKTGQYIGTLTYEAPGRDGPILAPRMAPSSSGTPTVRGKIKLNEPVDIVGLRSGGFPQGTTGGQTAQMRNWAHEVRKEISSRSLNWRLPPTGQDTTGFGGGVVVCWPQGKPGERRERPMVVYRWLMIHSPKPLQLEDHRKQLRPEAQKYELELEIVKMIVDRPDER